MPNANYIKGVRKERSIVNTARKKGFIAFRSAGSHSPIDVVVIDSAKRNIRLIQCKPESMSEKKKKGIEGLFYSLNGEYMCSYEVR